MAPYCLGCPLTTDHLAFSFHKWEANHSTWTFCVGTHPFCHFLHRQSFLRNKRRRKIGLEISSTTQFLWFGQIWAVWTLGVPTFNFFCPRTGGAGGGVLSTKIWTFSELGNTPQKPGKIICSVLRYAWCFQLQWYDNDSEWLLWHWAGWKSKIWLPHMKTSRNAWQCEGLLVELTKHFWIFFGSFYKKKILQQGVSAAHHNICIKEQLIGWTETLSIQSIQQWNRKLSNDANKFIRTYCNKHRW